MYMCDHALFCLEIGLKYPKKDTIGCAVVVHNVTFQLHLWQFYVPWVDKDQKLMCSDS